MKIRRRAAQAALKDFEEKGGNVADLQIKDEVLYTGSELFTVTLNPMVPGEKLLLDVIKSLPARRRGPKIRDLAVSALQGGASVANVRGLSIPTQPQQAFALPAAGPEEKNTSALDKLDEGWT